VLDFLTPMARLLECEPEHLALWLLAMTFVLAYGACFYFTVEHIISEVRKGKGE
jgi:hypothetical protein